MEKKEKFEEVVKKYFEVSRELRNECLEYIKKQCKKFGELDFTNMEDKISVAYNGGNHPEYASNCFSIVNSVCLDRDGSIILDIDDDPRYDIQEVPTEQVYDIADFIKNLYLPVINLENN